MRIGTLSLNINTDDLNYGAVLHSWAFQQILCQIRPQDTVEIIDYTSDMFTDFSYRFPVVSSLKAKRKENAIKALIAHSQYIRRYRKFESFEINHMHISKQEYTYEKMCNVELPYDCLICESDVIWSAQFFRGKFDPVFFLALDNMSNKKKIIYAASMANGGYTNAEFQEFKKLIEAPDFISCRETYAVEYVNCMTDRCAEHVLDPVLLLRAEDYESICAKKVINVPYLLLYIPVGYDKSYVKAAKEYAYQHSLKVVEISFFTWHKLFYTVLPDVGIEEFLSLIRNAEIVFTNSFHAVCFSILFHVEFYAFTRKTGRKTEDLCNEFGVSEHYMQAGNFRIVTKIDYYKVESLLEKKRDHSLKWLKKSLDA